MKLQWRHLANSFLSWSLVKVSASFWTVNEGRFKRVVGMHKLRAPRSRDAAYWGYTLRSSNRISEGMRSISSANCLGDTIVGTPISAIDGKVFDRGGCRKLSRGGVWRVLEGNDRRASWWSSTPRMED